MTSEIPSSSQLIYDLIESFGPLWEPEPPLYSCYCDVVAVKEIEDKLVVTITHTIIQCEGIEDLISDQPLSESDWPFETVYVKGGIHRPELAVSCLHYVCTMSAICRHFDDIR